MSTTLRNAEDMVGRAEAAALAKAQEAQVIARDSNARVAQAANLAAGAAHAASAQLDAMREDKRKCEAANDLKESEIHELRKALEEAQLAGSRSAALDGSSKIDAVLAEISQKVDSMGAAMTRQKDDFQTMVQNQQDQQLDMVKS